ncbi:lysoplasmalogenase [Sanguibacter sp. 25GB23B1]|uniref:lysoplasmalogenase n=1 Tax=unclassified Sanguibacter TaxID=2645534 RepID=UPI0032AFE803
MSQTRRLALLPGAAFALVALVHLGAHLGGQETLAGWSQWLLMPLLALTLAAATRPHGTRPPAGRSRRPRLVRLTLVALVASWLGDTAPDLASEGAGFLVMVGFFLVAQVVLVAAFWPYRDRSVLALGSRSARAHRRWFVVPYLVALLALVVACAPGADALLVPVVVYGLALVTMAVLSTGVNTLVWAGGAIFLVSDSLIALDAFADGYDLPRHGFWVMLTYIAAQVLVAAGVYRETSSAEVGRAISPLSRRFRRPLRAQRL